MDAPFESSLASDVSEYLLARTAEAYMSGDFEKFAAFFILPQQMETFEGRILIKTTDDLRDFFDAMRKHFCRLGITDLVRRCVVAEFRDPDTIEATHESRLLAGTRLVQPPYPCFSILKRTEAGWRVADGQYAIQDVPAHSSALTGATGSPPHSSHNGV